MRFANHILLLGLIALWPLQLVSQEPPDNRNVWTGGQKGYVVVSGDLSVLKNETNFHVTVIPGVKKMGAAEEPDSIYIPKKVNDLNEKSPGKGDEWLKQWNEARMNFEPAYAEGFNKIGQKAGVSVGNQDSPSNYTFILYTRNLMEFWGGMYIILDMDVVKTSDPGTKIATIRCPVNNSNLKSKNFKDDMNERAFYGAGYLFAKYFCKKVKQ